MKAAPLTTRPDFPLMTQSDIVSFFHLQMPRWLFSHSKYRSLSLEAKVAYTFLLNRFQLSRRGGWLNEAGEVFVVFPRESLAEEMQISYRKAIECFKELAAADLIWERRLGRLCREEQLVLLPGQEQDRQMISAIEVMRLLSGDTLPEFGGGSPPVRLAFYLEDRRGYLDFKIIPVAPGQERKVLLQLEPQLSRFVCTCIFIIRQEGQIARLAPVPRAYFALPDGEGEYRFLQAEDGGGGAASQE